MCDPWALRLLAEAAPEAQILIMLRDPVERYRCGVEREARLAEEAQVEPNIAVVGDPIYRGLYHRQVEQVLRLFGRDAVLRLQYERSPPFALRSTSSSGLASEARAAASTGTDEGQVELTG